MDAPQWSQTLPRPMEELENTTPPNNNNNNNISTNSTSNHQQQQQQETSLERRTRPQKDQNINCPRCNSTNTKFCYYNNYSLTQPRFFCKTCRRYWTQGGSLRSVPVGGGSRKNKRSSYSSQPQPPQQPPPPPPRPPLSTHQNPNLKFLEGQDLNLAFPIQGLLFNHHHNNNINIDGNNIKNQNYGLPINNMNNDNNDTTTTTATTTAMNSSSLSSLELLRSGIVSRGNLNPFVPMSIPDSSTIFQSGSYLNMNFSTSTNHEVDPNDHNNNNINNNNNEARLLFPFADMNKLATNNHEDDQSKGGYWSGMLGGGPW